MKNIFYVFLLMPLFYLGAQDEGPYLIRLHVVEVEGNIGAFIQANREYYKPLAAKAVEDGKWAGWSMSRSVTYPSRFIFFHHFSSPEQYAKPKSIWGANEAKELDPNATYAKAEFTINGMTCELGCANTIEKKIAKMDGVKSAKVDFDLELAMVEYDEAIVTPTSLEKTVTQVASTYKVEDMKTVVNFSSVKKVSKEDSK